MRYNAVIKGNIEDAALKIEEAGGVVLRKLESIGMITLESSRENYPKIEALTCVEIITENGEARL